MNEEEKKKYIDSLKREELEMTSSFGDIMSRSEKKAREREKTQQIEQLELKRRLMEESRKEKEAVEQQEKEQKELREYEIRKEKEQQKEDKKKKKNSEETFFPESDRERKKREKEEEKEQVALEKANLLQAKLEEKEAKKQARLEKSDFQMSKETTAKPLLIFTILFFILALGACVGYGIYQFFFAKSETNQLFLWIQSGVFILLTGSFGASLFLKEPWHKICGIIALLVLTLFVTFQFAIHLNWIKLPTEPLIPDFTGKNITEVLDWGQKNNITIEQSYEYSDTTEEYHIMSQSVATNTLQKDISKINVVVSSGPNYDKMILLPNMVGWNIEEVTKTINENFLNNVIIDYVINEEIEKDTVISQSLKGEMRRNDSLTITLSLGNEDALIPVAMVDLKGKSLFEATLWLKRNGIKYTIQYEFSDTVKRNVVLSQNTDVDTMVDPKTGNVTIIVSKGKKIVVPDLRSMTADEVTNWVIQNNLKIKYEDRYDETIEIGKIIEANVKAGDEIEEGTIISIVTSKGQLRMMKFNNLNEFRDWANKYSVSFKEEYQYSETIAKGSIIKFSVNENDVISNQETITVYISQGGPVKVPNFVGDTEAAARTKCKNAGLNCTFTNAGYNNATKGTVISQNKNVGATLTSGSNVVLSLSNGPASSFNVEISEAQLSIGNADGTIATLKSYFANKYPGVTFTFTKKASNTYNNAGFIHENSPIKDGSKVTQGNSYQIWITT